MTKVAFTPVMARLIIYHFKQERLMLAASQKPLLHAALDRLPFSRRTERNRMVQVNKLTVSSIKLEQIVNVFYRLQQHDTEVINTGKGFGAV